jgi:hypothetical protein
MASHTDNGTSLRAEGINEQFDADTGTGFVKSGTPDVRDARPVEERRRVSVGGVYDARGGQLRCST